LISRKADKTREILFNNEDIFTRAAKELGVLPDNQVKAFIGVEGINDINFFKNISKILALTDNKIPDLEVAEKEGHIIFVPLAGSNLSSWVNRLEKLNRPEFHFFDRDAEPPNPPKYLKEAELINARDDCIAVHTDCREAENYIHPDSIRLYWPDIDYDGHSPFCDVPTKIAQLLTQKNGANWGDIGDKARNSAELGVKRKLNNEVVKFMSPTQLNELDPQDTIRNFLAKIGHAISV
jgi:hypothetical protein